METLPQEIIICIFHLCNARSLIQLKIVCQEYSKAITTFMIQRKLFANKYHYLLRLNNLKDNSNISLHKCVNHACVNRVETRVQNKTTIALMTCMGLFYFYYPDELQEPHDVINDPYGLILYNPIRISQCRKAPHHKQFIHYCEDCMVDNLVLYERKDKLETPYGNKDGKIFN
mgnify:CR=1 FL=1